MNTRLQMTSVEEMIRMPDWRSDSPKKRNTRRPHTSRTIVAREAADLARRREPFARQREQFVHYLITRICGWVASSVCVKT